MFYIGCHLSKKKGMLIMAEAAASIGAKAIQFFTRNPRGGHEKAIDPRDLQRFNVFTKEHGIKYLLAYAPYTLEPASADTKQHDFAARSWPKTSHSLRLSLVRAIFCVQAARSI